MLPSSINNMLSSEDCGRKRHWTDFFDFKICLFCAGVVAITSALSELFAHSKSTLVSINALDVSMSFSSCLSH